MWAESMATRCDIYLTKPGTSVGVGAEGCAAYGQHEKAICNSRQGGETKEIKDDRPLQRYTSTRKTKTTFENKNKPGADKIGGQHTQITQWWCVKRDE